MLSKLLFHKQQHAHERPNCRDWLRSAVVQKTGATSSSARKASEHSDWWRWPSASASSSPVPLSPRTLVHTYIAHCLSCLCLPITGTTTTTVVQKSLPVAVFYYYYFIVIVAVESVSQWKQAQYMKQVRPPFDCHSKTAPALSLDDDNLTSKSSNLLYLLFYFTQILVLLPGSSSPFFASKKLAL